MEGESQPAGDSGIADPEDFEAAFRQHFSPVYRFIARRVGPALAEDLAAETFATAYRRRASFNPRQGSLRAWLYGIAVNLLRNHRRAEQHLLALDAQMAPQTTVPDDSDATDERVIAALLGPRLATALGQLNQEQREVLLLHAWADLRHDEIGVAMGIAPGTVRSRLSRARAALREHLGGFDFDLWEFEEPQADAAQDQGRDNA